jgi:hypothetical protein
VSEHAPLAAQLNAALSDGVVTDAEAAGLIRSASAQKLTKAETKELAAGFKAHSDAFEPAAQTRMKNFLAAAEQPAETADPRVMVSDRKTVRYSPATGQLYKAGVTASDVDQGAAGDCYFLGTLAAAARQNPKLITDAITQKADGSFVVRFYRNGPGGKPVADYVAVDRDLPRNTHWGLTQYAHSSQKGELWPAIMEKAYAKWKGGYQQIGMGGDPCDVMQALTGTAGNWSASTDGTPDALFAAMQSKLSSQGLVVASTNNGSTYNGTGIVPWHCYTVLGVSEQNGQQVVSLRNPWGHTEPGNPKGGDGVFQLPLAKFIDMFPNVYMSA